MGAPEHLSERPNAEVPWAVWILSGTTPTFPHQHEESTVKKSITEDCYRGGSGDCRSRTFRASLDWPGLIGRCSDGQGDLLGKVEKGKDRGAADTGVSQRKIETTVDVGKIKKGHRR